MLSENLYSESIVEKCFGSKVHLHLRNLKTLLAPTTKLSSEIQTAKIDIRIVRQKVKLVTSSLQMTMTRDSQHYDLIWKKTEKLVTEKVQKLLEEKRG